MNLNQAQTFLKENRVKYVLAQFVDIHGVAKTKSVPVSHFEDIVTDGAGFAGFAVWGLGQEPHDPDFMAVGDLDTLTLVPWQPGYARIVCTGRVNGEPHPFDTRIILQQQVNRLTQSGWLLNTGLEPEFMLLNRNPDGSVRPADPSDILEKPCYDYKGLSGSRGFLEKLVDSLQSVGFDVYQIDHEDANGQFEVNFTFSPALTSADRYVLFRMAASEIAREFGVICSFMPKPMSNRTGTGSHIHMSIWDGQGKDLFRDDSDKNRLGLSELAYHFLGGLLAHAPALTALVAPSVNSYKRPGGGPLAVRGHLGSGLYLLWGQQPDLDGAGPLRAARVEAVRLQLQPLSGDGGRDRGGPGRHRAQAGPRTATQHQPLPLHPGSPAGDEHRRTPPDPDRSLESPPGRLPVCGATGRSIPAGVHRTQGDGVDRVPAPRLRLGSPAVSGVLLKPTRPGQGCRKPRRPGRRLSGGSACAESSAC